MEKRKVENKKIKFENKKNNYIAPLYIVTY